MAVSDCSHALVHLLGMSRVVKSAVRVLEVFEFFDRRQAEATITEICHELNYPQSSTSILLQNLSELGYLQRGIDGRSFLPTQRVTILGSWIAPVQKPSEEAIALMRSLGHATGETIILAALVGDSVRYLYVVPATTAMRLHVGPGLVRPLATSGAGRLFMSTMGEEQVRRIIVRHNAAEINDTRRLSMAAVRRDLATIRETGYAVSLDRITPGAGVIALLLPDGVQGVPQAVAIGGLSRTVRDKAEFFAQLMRKEIRQHLKKTSDTKRAHNGRGN